MLVRISDEQGKLHQADGSDKEIEHNEILQKVILPHILDQFYWAHRVAVLGLGPRALPVELANADVLADRLVTALNDPRIAARAGALAPAIRSRNGVDAAVDHLERLAVDSAA